MRYLTKDWYIACQTDPMTPEVQKRLDEIDRAYCAAQTREALPDGLLRRFFFHDGAVREIVTGTDLTLRIDSPYSEYHTVTFRNANVKQEPPRVGAVWLYRELYRHKSGRRIRTAEFAFGIAVVCRGGGGSDGIFDFTDETVVISVCGEDLSAYIEVAAVESLCEFIRRAEERLINCKCSSSDN